MPVTKGVFNIETSLGTSKLTHTTIYSRNQPVLLIHGFGSTSEIWFKSNDSLGNVLLKNNFDVWTIKLSHPVIGDIKSLAHEEVFEALEFINDSTGKKIRIIAHSMGGLIARFMVTENILHPYQISEAIEKIEGITLLAVPNHGIKSPKLLLKLKEYIYKKNSSPSELEVALVQLLDSSEVVQILNTGKQTLNPKIKWQNAIGIYDEIVDTDSASFTKEELEDEIRLDQKEFPCDHMIYPLTENNTIKKILDSFNIKINPAIHTYLPVAEWIMNDLKNNS